MAAPKFAIRAKTSNATVYYNISIASKVRLTGKTDVSVDHRYWNPRRIENEKGELIQVYIDSDKALSVGKKKEAEKNQDKLDKFYKWAKKEEDKIKKEPNPKELLRYAIEEYFGRNKDSVKYTTKESFLDSFKTHTDYIQGKKTGVSDETLEHYKRLKNFLTDFSRDKKIPLLYEYLTQKFYIKFRKYLIDPEGKDLSEGYANLMTQKLVAVLGGAKDLGYHDNTQYNRFTQKEVKSFGIYLTEKEVQEIRDIKLDDVIDRAARDYFILLCRTGARVNDALKWTKENIVYVKEIKIIEGVEKEITVKKIRYRHSKTKKLHPIVITSEIQTILDKWNNFPNNEGGFPNERGNIEITDDIINRRIKKIARYASITDEVTGIKKKKEITKDKCEWITSHTGKRTAATLAYLKGMPIWEIRGTITMHSSDKITLIYIKTDDELEDIMKTRGDVSA